MVSAGAVELGSGAFRYEALATWEQLPEGMTLVECAGVAVDAEDLVYLLTRNVDNPVIVLEPGGGVLRSFGAGVFTDRTHAISVGPDGFLYCADDGSHTITKWTREGELVLTIGEPGVSSERHSGEPFNRPTDAAVSSNDGSIFISDGYGNARIHRYSAGGELELSWGEPASTSGSSWSRTTSRSTKTTGSTSRTARAIGCRSSTATAGRSRCGTTSTAPAA